MSTSLTGKQSSSLNGEDFYSRSNIKGALPVKFGDYGYRITTVGGLLDVDDVNVLRDVDVGRSLGVTILDEIPRE